MVLWLIRNVKGRGPRHLLVDVSKGVCWLSLLHKYLSVHKSQIFFWLQFQVTQPLTVPQVVRSNHYGALSSVLFQPLFLDYLSLLLSFKFLLCFHTTQYFLFDMWSLFVLDLSGWLRSMSHNGKIKDHSMHEMLTVINYLWWLLFSVFQIVYVQYTIYNHLWNETQIYSTFINFRY